MTQAEAIQHPADSVARYAQQLGRAMAIASARLHSTNQCDLRSFADYSVQRVGPILHVDLALDELGSAILHYHIVRHPYLFGGSIFGLEGQIVDVDTVAVRHHNRALDCMAELAAQMRNGARPAIFPLLDS